MASANPALQNSSPFLMGEKARNLRQQAASLRDPKRRDGPSVHEASEVAAELDAQADQLDCDAFYSLTPKPQ